MKAHKEKSFITIEEACALMKVSSSTFQKICKKYSLPCYHPKGKKNYFLKGDIEAWIAEHGGEYPEERYTARNDRVAVIATKVTKADKAKFQEIADGLGMSFYTMIQAVYLCLLRFFDNGTPISYEHNALVNSLGNLLLNMGNNIYNPISTAGRDKDFVSGAILLVSRPQKKGEQLVMVKNKGNGAIYETYNFDSMIEAMFGSMDNDVLKALKREKAERGYFSLSHTLHELILERASIEKDNMRAEINEMFSDNRRTMTGEAENRETHYKRKRNKSSEEYTGIIPKRKWGLVEF